MMMMMEMAYGKKPTLYYLGPSSLKANSDRAFDSHKSYCLYWHSTYVVRTVLQEEVHVHAKNVLRVKSRWRQILDLNQYSTCQYVGTSTMQVRD